MIKYPQKKIKTFYPKNTKKLNINKSFKKFSFDWSLKLIALDFGNLNYKEMVSVRFKINKLIKKNSLLRFYAFPMFSKTKKPIEVRMGKGKGAIETFAFKIRPGTCICELYTKSYLIGIKALKLLQYRLNLKTKIVTLIEKK